MSRTPVPAHLGPDPSWRSVDTLRAIAVDAIDGASGRCDGRLADPVVQVPHRGPRPTRPMAR